MQENTYNQMVKYAGGEVCPIGEVKQEKFAAIILGKDHACCLFDVSTAKKRELSIIKIAESNNEIPLEVLDIAKSNINTHYMTMTGSRKPLFQKHGSCDTNIIKFSNIDWDAYYQNFKTAENTNKESFVVKNHVFPLHNSVNIKAAITFFDKKSSIFPGEDRIKFARKIKESALKHNIKISPFVEKYASLHKRDNIGEYIDDRIDMASGYPETVSFLRSIKNDHLNDDPLKLAKILSLSDKMMPFATHLNPISEIGGAKYAMSLRIPMDAFEIVFGQQLAKEDFVDKVANIPESQLKKHFSDTFISQIQSSPEQTIKKASQRIIDILNRIIDEN